MSEFSEFDFTMQRLLEIRPEQVDSTNKIYENLKGEMQSIHINLDDYNVYRSDKDADGVYRVLEYKRGDGTLHMKSTMSNPDVDGNYQTLTCDYYKEDGITLDKTIIWSFTYDSAGGVLTMVKQ